MNPKHVAMVKSYLKTFVAVILSMFLADGADIFAVDTADLRAWLAAGIGSLAPLIYTALDSGDPRFGRGSE